jgi:phosphopantothenate-cysteine ligase
VIVGFKLLSDTDEQTLVCVGRSLLEKNSCNFVLANDMKTVGGDRHEGLLIARDGSYERAVCKEDIAVLIVKRVFENLRIGVS